MLKPIIRLFILFPILLISIQASLFSATYYVSNSVGDDSRTAAQAQNQATPWQTLSMVNGTTFLAGDSILFKRNNTWYGTLTVASSGANGNPITYAAYGTGANPEIKGAKALAGTWSIYSGSIYQVDCPDTLTALFLDGIPMALARFPNTGYLAIDSVLDSVTLRCNALPGTDWTNARIHVRTEHWTIASKNIVACNTAQKTLRLNAVPNYDLRPEWGFFINNSLAALDSAGEWFYDASTHKVYLYMPDNAPPTIRNVEGSVMPFGVLISGKSNVVITGLALTGQSNSGVHITNSTNILFERNTIIDPDVNGIWVDGSSSANVISGNLILGANKNGILSHGSNTVISGNTIRRIALVSRFTKSGMGDECCSGLGIEASGDNLTISGNILDSIGYIGIRNGSGKAVIEKNFIQHCCVSKDDGGGIYCGWQTDTMATGIAGTIIRKNIVFSTQSVPEGTPGSGYFPGQGIYIDDYGHDITIENNTAAHCVDNGIFLHNTRRIRVSGNTLFNNGKRQVAYGENDYPGKPIPMSDNWLFGNRTVSLSSAQRSFSMSSTFTSSNFGVSDSNTYWNPFDKSVISYRNTPYTLPQWQTTMGQDAASTVAPVSWNSWVIRDTVGPEMIVNGNFDVNTASWGSWPSTCILSRDTGHGMNGGCLKAISPWDGASQPIVVSSTFKLVKDHTYLLSFSVAAAHSGSLIPVVRQSYSPYGTRAATRWVSMDLMRQDYQMLLVAMENDSPCRVDFNPSHTDSLFWLDNIHLCEVNADTFLASSQVFLYANPTFRDSVIALAPGLKKLDGTPAPSLITLSSFASEVYYSDIALNAELFQPNGEILQLSAFPNPFNPMAMIRVAGANLPAQPMKIGVYDIRGRKVADLSRNLRNGLAIWDARNYPTGVYLVRLIAGKQTRQLKLTLIR